MTRFTLPAILAASLLGTVPVLTPDTAEAQERFDRRSYEMGRRDADRDRFVRENYERGYRQGRRDRETFDREYFNRGPVGANEGARGSWIARQTDTVYGGDERYLFGRDTWRGRIPGQPGAEYPPTFNRPGRGGYEAWEGGYRGNAFTGANGRFNDRY